MFIQITVCEDTSFIYLIFLQKDKDYGIRAQT